MNKATKICTINDITSIEFHLANSIEIENYGISFEHGVEKFQSESVVLLKICQMVIYVEMH